MLRIALRYIKTVWKDGPPIVYAGLCLSGAWLGVSGAWDHWHAGRMDAVWWCAAGGGWAATSFVLSLTNHRLGKVVKRLENTTAEQQRLIKAQADVARIMNTLLDEAKGRLSPSVND